LIMISTLFPSLRSSANVAWFTRLKEQGAFGHMGFYTFP
jgi:hypothetical protein